jgi:hypothetical protein
MFLPQVLAEIILAVVRPLAPMAVVGLTRATTFPRQFVAIQIGGRAKTRSARATFVPSHADIVLPRTWRFLAGKIPWPRL